MSLDIFIDLSSVEIFSGDGTIVQTNTVYPTEAYHTINLDGINASIKVRPLNSVWKYLQEKFSLLFGFISIYD